jgi:hypothetical protein
MYGPTRETTRTFTVLLFGWDWFGNPQNCRSHFYMERSTLRTKIATC